jgi:hypothetical protein
METMQPFESFQMPRKRRKMRNCRRDSKNSRLRFDTENNAECGMCGCRFQFQPELLPHSSA